MFPLIEDLGLFFKTGHRRNCNPICATCEVEVSEKTAVAITKLLDRRIKQVSEDPKIAGELLAQKELILKGFWHSDYDSLT